MTDNRIAFDAFAERQRQHAENLVLCEFPIKVGFFDDLLNSEQFSWTKLGTLMTDTKAVPTHRNTKVVQNVVHVNHQRCRFILLNM